MSDDFYFRLDLQMKYNALGSLKHGMALLACSLTWTEFQRLFNYLWEWHRLTLWQQNTHSLKMLIAEILIFLVSIISNSST